MKKLTTFNKIFILFWIVLIIFIILKAPHERETGAPDEDSKSISGFDTEK